LQSADLVAPTAGQQEKAHYLAEAIIAQAAPQLPKLLLRQHTITACASIGLPRSLDGIGFCQPLLDCPREEGGECTAQAIAGGWAGRGFDLS